MNLEIEKYNQHGFDIGSKTTGKIQTTCPFCSHKRKKKSDKCATVYLDTAYYKCHHCYKEGQLHKYKRKTDKVYKKPQPIKPQNFSEKTIEYYKEYRGISLNTLNEAPIKETKAWMPKAQSNVNVIAYEYYVYDELINVKYRAKGKDFRFESGCELTLYNINNIIDNDEAIIVEGEEDVLAFWEAGFKNCVSVPNGFPKPSNQQLDLQYINSVYDFFKDKKKIYIAVDNDENGENGAKELIRRFGSEKCYIVDFKDCKDASEYLVRYDKKSLKDTLFDAKQIPVEDVYTLNDYEEALVDFWENGTTNGMTVDIPNLDKGYSIELRQYTLLVSPPGSGKSDLVDHIALKMSLKYNMKTAYCSIENEPFEFHYDKLYRKLVGRRPLSSEIKNNSIKEYKDHINDNFYHVKFEKRYKLQNVLDKFQELVNRKGVRFFVIDPFNKVRLDGVSRSDINIYTEEYHIMIDDFCKKNNAHLFLVVHPTKMKKIDGTETFEMPNGYSIKGGGEHFDMSYNILGMVRNMEHDYVWIRTLKVKFQHLGTSGQDAYCKWNPINGRFADLHDLDRSVDINPELIDFDYSNWLIKENDPLTEKLTRKMFKMKEIKEYQNNSDVTKHAPDINKDLPF